MTKPQSTRSFGSKVALNAIAMAVGSVSRIVGGVFVARLLGPELNGNFVYMLWLAETAVLSFGLGFPILLNRYVALKIGESDELGAKVIIRFCYFGAILLGLVSAASVYYFATNFLLVSSGSEALPLALATLVAAQFWAGVSQATVTGLQQFNVLLRVTLIYSMALLVGQIGGSMLFGTVGAIYGTTSAHGLSAIISILYVVRSGFLSARIATKAVAPDPAILKYSLDAWLALLISSIVWGRTELFFLSHSASAAQAGLYAAALTFFGAINQAVTLFAGALLPHFASQVGKQDISRLENNYQRATVNIALFVFPLAMGAIALTHELTTILFGEAYLDAVPAARWLIAAGMLLCTTPGSSVVYAFGGAKIIRDWAIVVAPALIFLYAIVAPTAGAEGVAATRFLMNAAMICVGLRILVRHYQIRPPLRALTAILVAATCCSLAAYITSRLVHGEELRILVGTFCGFFVYCFAIRVLKVISDEDANAIGQLFAKAPFGLGGVATALFRLLRSQ